VAGCYDVAAPPAFDPFVGIDFHEHQHKERHANMERQDEGEDGEEPGRRGGFYWIKGKARPRGWLHAAVMAFMGPFK